VSPLSQQAGQPGLERPEIDAVGLAPQATQRDGLRPEPQQQAQRAARPDPARQRRLQPELPTGETASLHADASGEAVGRVGVEMRQDMADQRREAPVVERAER